VTAPTIVVSSDDTFFTRLLLENDVASRFPNVKLADVPRTGHWPHVEAPRAVAEILDRFIDAAGQRPDDSA
jgi:pimeloyl-ACP methyl ester carboxylesterase